MNFDDLPLTKNCAVQSKIFQELPPFIIEITGMLFIFVFRNLLQINAT